MTSYKINFRLDGANKNDYERLFRELKTELIVKLRTLQCLPALDASRGAEYVYFGTGTLQEVTAAAYQAAHNLGREYSFTIIKQKGSLRVVTFENELIQHA
jgi:uncharacterized protein (DUF1684 family)